MRNTAIVCLVLLLPTVTSHAAVFRCVGPDGAVTFTDSGCEGASPEVQINQSSSGLSATDSDGLSERERALLDSLDTRTSNSSRPHEDVARSRERQRERCREARESRDKLYDYGRRFYKGHNYNYRKEQQDKANQRVREYCAP